jgi:PPOX class probable F420-dependent enzyme
MQIDTATDFGARVARRLDEEIVIWLTTVDSHGTPQPRPVWFLWDGEAFFIYSMPGAHKVDHIRRGSRVALNLNTNKTGGDVVVITGDAVTDPLAPPADQNEGYVAKYAEHMAAIGYTPESFAAAYSVPIRVTPTDLRGS